MKKKETDVESLISMSNIPYQGKYWLDTTYNTWLELTLNCDNYPQLTEEPKIDWADYLVSQICNAIDQRKRTKKQDELMKFIIIKYLPILKACELIDHFKLNG